ncbi:MAG: PepSY domain-containing protein, partial [Rubrimonas sp.]
DRSMRIPAAAALLTLALAAPAAAQTISAEEAIAIAREAGMVEVRDVELDDGREWEIEGRDAQGRKIEVDIDARTGAVIKVERD